MRQLIFSEENQGEYPIVLLVPVLRKDEIQKEYIDLFGIPHGDVTAVGLHYSQTKKKTPAGEMKEFVSSELVPVLEDMKAQYLVVADSEYFKVLTKADKVEANLGYVLDCVYGPWKVIYVPNYRSIFYDPVKIRAKIKQGMDALISHVTGEYETPGSEIIQFAAYPRTNEEIQGWLNKLLDMNCPLAIDIEAFSLKHHLAGIGTITFCWNKTEGIAFPVDYEEIPGATEAPFGKQGFNAPVRAMLKDFFIKYTQKQIYHNISFDVYVLIYQLFMEHAIDTEGLLYGMEVMLRDWDDTKLITYLATNSCSGNKLSLKEQAQQYAGNYAESEIEDIRRIPLDKLLKYNLIDGLSTWFVHERHYQTMIDDEQGEIYETLFKPATLDIIQMQLTGMPISLPRVAKVKEILTAIMDAALVTIRGSKIIQEYEHKRLEDYTAYKNSEWKKKKLTVQEMAIAAQTSEAVRKEVTFNPNSGPQMQELLFEILGLPVISLTDSKQPSVDGDTIEALVNHTTDQAIKDFLLAMQDYNAVNKILTAFIPAFEQAVPGPDGWHYLCGNFNLGGTVSGRLSSSNPNLQNLPANVFMAISAAILALYGEELKPYMAKGKLGLGKLIKSCFIAPKGWVFCGLDFASLEDRISALTTKDPNKLRVYTDGFDGHCLRAHAYFGDQMPDIEQADSGALCYKANVGGTDVYFHENEDIEYLGTKMKGRDLYVLLSSKGI